MFLYRFVAVFFRGECTGEDDDCDGVLAKVSTTQHHLFLFFFFIVFILNFVIQLIIDQLEGVDDELDEIGILLVSTPDEEVAQEHGQHTLHVCH